MVCVSICETPSMVFSFSRKSASGACPPSSQGPKASRGTVIWSLKSRQPPQIKRLTVMSSSIFLMVGRYSSTTLATIYTFNSQEDKRLAEYVRVSDGTEKMWTCNGFQHCNFESCWQHIHFLPFAIYHVSTVPHKKRKEHFWHHHLDSKLTGLEGLRGTLISFVLAAPLAADAVEAHGAISKRNRLSVQSSGRASGEGGLGASGGEGRSRSGKDGEEGSSLHVGSDSIDILLLVWFSKAELSEFVMRAGPWWSVAKSGGFRPAPAKWRHWVDSTVCILL